VLDAGCGPGHWTNHLAGRGLEVRGIDLVPAFIEHARTSYPDVAFDFGSIIEQAGNVADLDYEDENESEACQNKADRHLTL
jgi:trans-aconitate methyltransferase